jgi:DNA invertase Pin-like site-specific DNA recombinase
MNRRNGRPTPTNKPSRAVCYVRISKDRENETSTETQEERVRAYCTAHGWTVVDVIVEPGRSAYKASRSSRPGFRRAWSLIETDAADVLVVWKLDRAARNTEDTLALVRELGASGAQFASVTEQFDTSTASGRMMLTVLAALAEMESATKSERVQAWQDRRRTTGQTPTGPRPFGYRRERNELHVVDDEAAVLRQVAAEVLAGLPLRTIAKALEVAGVVGTNGRAIHRTVLRRMLLAPTIAACREVDDGVFVASPDWQPILDRETWDEVRAVLTDPARRTTTGNARRWLLSGMAVCGRCADGTKMAARRHSDGTPRYFCPVCHLSVEVARTDEIVEQHVVGFLDPKTWRRFRQGRRSVVDTDAFETAMDALNDRFKAGDIEGTELGRLADELRRQQEIASTPAPPLPDVPDVAKAWEGLSLEQRRLLIATMTESLTIKPWQPTNRFDQSRVVWVPVA